MNHNSCGLLLAAGYSRRFGSDKRRALCTNTMGERATLLWHAIRGMVALCDHVVIALKEGDQLSDLLQDMPPLPDAHYAVLMIASSPSPGIGHTLSHAIDQMCLPTFDKRMAEPLTQGLWVMLADMPFIEPDTFKALANQRRIHLSHHSLSREQRAAAVLVPTYRGRRGHPVYFGPDWYDTLRQLRGDQGAKPLLQSAEGVMELEVDDPMICQDIDRPSDLASLKR